MVSLEILKVNEALPDLSNLTGLRRLEFVGGFPPTPPPDLGAVLQACTRLQVLRLNLLPPNPLAVLRSSSLQELTLDVVAVTDVPTLFGLPLEQAELPALRQVQMRGLKLNGLTPASAAATAASLRLRMGSAPSYAVHAVEMGHECVEWHIHTGELTDLFRIDLDAHGDARVSCSLLLEAFAPLQGSAVFSLVRCLELSRLRLAKKDMQRLLGLFNGINTLAMESTVRLADSSLQEAAALPSLGEVFACVQDGAFAWDVINACTAAQLSRQGSFSLVLRDGDGVPGSQERSRARSNILRTWEGIMKLITPAQRKVCIYEGHPL